MTSNHGSEFLKRVLRIPSYGFETPSGELYVPTHREILKEFFFRLNIFRSRKNWLPFVTWLFNVFLFVFLFLFLFQYFSWPLLIAGFFYSMVGLGSHGTLYLHRYGTHRAYRFRNSFFLFLVRNLSMKIIPEETYIISHHVHHRYSEKPYDPYNVHAGWLYCFLADVNHQLIATDLDEKDYIRLTKLMTHTGVRVNSYKQYQKWGTLCHPGWSIAHWVLGWAFWFGVFYLLGGLGLAFALFGMSGVWALGVRTFNYSGHGGGKDKRREGIDFNWEDLSINQLWPGFVSGEWHNNHHLYPDGARAGFLSYQIDLPWYAIWFLHKIGGVTSYLDHRSKFMRDHYFPFQKRRLHGAAVSKSTNC